MSFDNREASARVKVWLSPAGRYAAAELMLLQAKDVDKKWDPSLAMGQGLTMDACLIFIDSEMAQQQMRSTLFHAVEQGLSTEGVDQAVIRQVRAWCNMVKSHRAHRSVRDVVLKGGPQHLMPLPKDSADFEREMGNPTITPTSFEKCVHRQYLKEVFGNH